MAALTRTKAKQNTLYGRRGINTIYRRNTRRTIYGKGLWDDLKKLGKKLWDNKDKIIKVADNVGKSGLLSDAKNLFKKIKDGKIGEAIKDGEKIINIGSTLYKDNEKDVRSILGIGKHRTLYGPPINPDKVALKTYLSAPVAKRNIVNQPHSRVGFDTVGISQVLPEMRPKTRSNNGLNPRKVVKKMSKQYIKKIMGSGIKQL